MPGRGSGWNADNGGSNGNMPNLGVIDAQDFRNNGRRRRGGTMPSPAAPVPMPAPMPRHQTGGDDLFGSGFEDTPTPVRHGRNDAGWAAPSGRTQSGASGRRRHQQSVTVPAPAPMPMPSNAAPDGGGLWDDEPRRGSGIRVADTQAVTHGALEEQPKRNNRRGKTKVTSKPRKARGTQGMGFLAHPVRFVKEYGVRGLWDALMIWSGTHQAAYLSFALVAILIGIAINKYITVGAALVMVFLGYKTEDENDDADPLLIYISALIAFIVPFTF